jgi:hypothetical protein
MSTFWASIDPITEKTFTIARRGVTDSMIPYIESLRNGEWIERRDLARTLSGVGGNDTWEPISRAKARAFVGPDVELDRPDDTGVFSLDEPIQGASADWDETKHPRDHGRFSESEGAKNAGRNERAERAAASHKRSTAEKQRWAEGNESPIASLLGGSTTGDNMTMDIVVDHPEGPVGVEVKTLLDNKNSKITMHPESRRRKEAWAEKTGGKLFTVVIDDRHAFAEGKAPGHGRAIYYREGVGAFQVKNMVRVDDMNDLRSKILGGKR